MTPRRPRRLARLLAAACVTACVASLTSCGLPGDGTARAVDDDAVPYGLLERSEAPATSAPGSGVAGSVPVVFWVVDDERLVPSASGASCDEGPDVARQLLEELAAGPPEAERVQGRSTSIPPGSGIELTGVADGRAVVELEPAAPISADRLPQAVGQLVLTATSAAGVDSVSLAIDGEVVQVPLPGGALAEGPVSADDYAVLVPDRVGPVGAIGCDG